MFENILYQDRLVESLVSDIQTKSLPQSILFSGPAWSGKLSTALELARVLSCSVPKAPWNCTCQSCSMQRTLGSPYVMLLGKRNFGQEIRGAGLALLQEDKDAVRYLFLRTVRKLLRRFDPVLWEGDSKLSKIAKAVEVVEELLLDLQPGQIQSKFDKTSLQSRLEAIYEACDTVADFLPQDGVNAAMIRHATYWAHTADSSCPKFVILEAPEALNETARNSLLKTLEEPPAGVWFILLARHRQGIMQTILSRVRHYSFADRGALESDVIARVFRQVHVKHQDLRSYFRAADPEACQLCDRVSDALWSVLTHSPGAPGFEALQALSVQAKHYLEDVLNLLHRHIREALTQHTSLSQLADLHAISERITEEGRSALVYNRTLASVSESLYTWARKKTV